MNLRINDWLTVSRIIATPFIIFSFYSPIYRKFGLVLFTLSCITDILDGYIARLFKMESRFGKIMDPLADKWMSLSLLFLLTHLQQMDYIGILASYLILFREIFVMGIRMVSKENIISSSKIGKLKTLFLNIGVFLIFYNLIYGYGYMIGKYALLLASILSIISGARYYKLFLGYNSNSKKLK